MHSRREFLIMAAGAGALVSVDVPAFAQEDTEHVKRATAITQVFGDGARLTAVAVEYDAAVDGRSLSPDTFRVEGRTVTGVFTSASADPAGRADAGRFVIVTLSPDDAKAGLATKIVARS
ncbi:hypothetical protein [Rhizobium sp. M1]|uniref:hypothetical protein n=1 Tax=Rhizobium sp. M1 TaxID=2035453 RepID=UPI000BE906D5|nr:hypothetical protein [Rhizobium sp. M1]PDT12000.1 hypothetical protein CO655_07115 [Rhizobium sp. M1]